MTGRKNSQHEAALAGASNGVGSGWRCPIQRQLKKRTAAWRSGTRSRRRPRPWMAGRIGSPEGPLTFRGRERATSGSERWWGSPLARLCVASRTTGSERPRRKEQRARGSEQRSNQQFARGISRQRVRTWEMSPSSQNSTHQTRFPIRLRIRLPSVNHLALAVVFLAFFVFRASANASIC